MVADKLGYVSQRTTVGALIKRGPAGLFSITSTVTGGVVTIYDDVSATGTILFTKTLTVGDVIHWGGTGIAANKGLYIVVTGTVIVAYT